MSGSCINRYGYNNECDTSAKSDECSGTYRRDGPVSEYVSTCFPTQGAGCRCHDGGTRNGVVRFEPQDYCNQC